MTTPRRTVGILAVGALIAAAALLGPRARVDEARVAPVSPEWDLAGWIRAEEARVPGIRPGDGKEIVWADPAAPAHTELSVVYLHGFSADRHEISPTVERVAEALGANLFLTRLAGHGMDGPALGEATAEDWLQDAEDALTVGVRLGSRVVLVGTSTGATLATWAAAQERWRDRLAALVLISPNFGPVNDDANRLLWPWGGLMARVMVGPERCFEPLNAEQARHWTTCYPTRALLPMMALVDHVRDMDLSAVTAPLLVLYAPADQVVDARATEALVPRFGSAVREVVRMEGAGDPSHHVLAGDIMSPGTTDAVIQHILDFLRR